MSVFHEALVFSSVVTKQHLDAGETGHEAMQRVGGWSAGLQYLFLYCGEEVPDEEIEAAGLRHLCHTVWRDPSRFGTTVVVPFMFRDTAESAGRRLTGRTPG